MDVVVNTENKFDVWAGFAASEIAGWMIGFVKRGFWVANDSVVVAVDPKCDFGG